MVNGAGNWKTRGIEKKLGTLGYCQQGKYSIFNGTSVHGYPLEKLEPSRSAFQGHSIGLSSELSDRRNGSFGLTFHGNNERILYNAGEMLAENCEFF